MRPPQFCVPSMFLDLIWQLDPFLFVLRCASFTCFISTSPRSRRFSRAQATNAKSAFFASNGDIAACKSPSSSCTPALPSFLVAHEKGPTPIILPHLPFHLFSPLLFQFLQIFDGFSSACSPRRHLPLSSWAVLISPTSRRISLGPLDALRLLSSSCLFCPAPRSLQVCSPPLLLLLPPCVGIPSSVCPAVSPCVFCRFSPSGAVHLVRFACLSTVLSMYSFVRLWASSAFAVPFSSASISFDIPRCAPVASFP